MINNSDLKRKIFTLAKNLAKMPKDAEYAIIVYEDGHVSPIITQKLFSGAIIPFRHNFHGIAIAVLHTHPVPRSAPSIADLNLLFNMSMYNTPAYLGTIYRSGDEAVLTLYIANKRIDPFIGRKILSESYIYEILNVRGGFRESFSDKQIYEQHKLFQKYGITIERYKFKL